MLGDCISHRKVTLLHRYGTIPRKKMIHEQLFLMPFHLLGAVISFRSHLCKYHLTLFVSEIQTSACKQDAKKYTMALSSSASYDNL